MNQRQQKQRWSFHPGEAILRVTTGLVVGIILSLFAGPVVSGAAALAVVALLLAALVARTSRAGIGWLLGGFIVGTAVAEATWLVWFILSGGFNGD